MSDISAVVLTIGEETTERAIDSLKNQTVPPEETIVIENVTPFHKALNLGASRVKTEYFVQVDADMVLDPNCLKDLRSCFRKDIGLVVGYLRDDVVGRISGIKMFRTKCFESVQFKDSISPDTDFTKDLLKYGYKMRYASKFTGSDANVWHTFGEHKHACDPSYFFSKYLLEGIRYRYRKAVGGLVWRFKWLQRRGHDLSLICQIALAHGIFLKDEKDLLEPFSADKDYNILKDFAGSKGEYTLRKPDLSLFFIFKPETVFRKFYNLGISLRKHGSFASFEYCMDELSKSYDPFAWMAKVGLFQGLFSGHFDEERVKEEYGMLKEMLSKYNIFYIMAKKILSIPMGLLPVRFHRPEKYKI